jgi:purine-nucleoside phosphorylase
MKKILFPKSKKPFLKEISTPAAYVKKVAAGLKLPSRAIVCPIAFLTKYVISHAKYKKYNCVADIYVLEGKDLCYVSNTGYGAPWFTMAMESLIALGVKEMIFIGLAGSLQEEVQPADIVLCDEALCDDGTSPCYTDKETSFANKTLLNKFARTLKKNKVDFHVGRNWSTDAIFRETKEEVIHYQKHDVLSVEMETAALYAVCQRRKVRAVSSYVISDCLYDYKWDPHFREDAIWKGMEVLYENALATLCK